MKDYEKIKEPFYLKNWNVNNLYGWSMSENFPLDGFKLVENRSQFNEDFTKKL